MGATEILARYGVTATAADIPEEILHEGKRCFINFLAVALYVVAAVAFLKPVGTGAER